MPVCQRSLSSRLGTAKVSEGGGYEYRADDRVWAGQMTGQHGPVLRFVRHDAQRERLLQPTFSRKKERREELLPLCVVPHEAEHWTVLFEVIWPAHTWSSARYSRHPPSLTLSVPSRLGSYR